MAQAGYTPISLYYSTTSTQEPTAGNLVSGELAINIADGKLFYKNSAGNVRLLSIGYGSSSVTPTNGGVQYGTGTDLALTAAGSSGQILRSNGAAAPTWADLSTLGVNTISFGTTGLTPNSATAGAVTVAGTLVTANGGTGLGGATPFTANGVLYASSASALTSGSALTFDGTTLVTKNVNLGLPGTGTNHGTETYNLSASNPGTFFQNLDYIAYRHAWFVGVSASEGMRLTSTGLGIGTSSPAGKLHVAGQARIQDSANAANYILIGSGANAPRGGNSVMAQTGSMVMGTEAASNLVFITNAAEAARFDSSGNLGLGVTPSAWASGTYRALQIGSRASFVQGASDTYVGNNWINDGTNKYIATAAASLYGQVSGAHQWYTAPSGTAGNAITFSQVMTLDASGNLGIGTSSPAFKLDVTDAVSASPIRLTSGAGTNIRFDTTRSFTVNRNWLVGCDYIAEGMFSIIPSTTIGGGTFSNPVLNITASGNLGLGVTPSAWSNASNYGAMQMRNASLYFRTGASELYVGNNHYYNGTNWIYVSSTEAARYDLIGGQHQWFTAPSGTAGNAISFTQALTLDASGNLLLGGTSAGASSAASLAIFNGTAPTGSVTNGIILYAEDVSSSSELKVRDEAGNVTTLSPHNFSLIPDGPSEDMAWAYYSEKGGKRINVDMLKLARMVEKLTGEKLVYES